MTRAAKNPDLARALADAIVRARSEAGLTQAQLAEAARLSQSTVSRLENGHLTLVVDELARVAFACNRMPHELMEAAERYLEDIAEPTT